MSIGGGVSACADWGVADGLTQAGAVGGAATGGEAEEVLLGLLRLRFWFWASSRAICCLSLLDCLLLKSLTQVLQGGHSLLIGSSSLTFLQFLIEHRILEALRWFI